MAGAAAGKVAAHSPNPQPERFYMRYFCVQAWSGSEFTLSVNLTGEKYHAFPRSSELNTESSRLGILGQQRVLDLLFCRFLPTRVTRLLNLVVLET